MSDSMRLAQGYLGWFGLDSAPFTIAPDPGFLYPSTAHREALTHLRYGLDREGGFILLTGEVGTGKTTLTRLLLDQLPAQFDVAYLVFTQLDSADLLVSICNALDVDVSRDGTLSANVDALNAALTERHARGRRVLLVFEEAQSLSAGVLEFLRMLTNLGTNTERLLHVLLVGQPELLETLGDHSLRQLDQRVVARYHLRPLTGEELEHYVVHRLSCSGCGESVFGRQALRQLHRLSGGIPRLANLIAERCLVDACARGTRAMTAEIVRTAANRVLGCSSHAVRRSPMGLYTRHIVFGLFGMTLAAATWSLWPERSYVQQLESAVLAPAPLPPMQPVDAVQDGSDGMPDPQTDISARSPGTITVMSVYETLLSAWGIYATVPDSDALCSVARSRQLQCQWEVDLSYEQLLARETPAIVRLGAGAEHADIFMLASITAESVTLLNAGGESRISRAEFDAVWDHAALLLVNGSSH